MSHIDAQIRASVAAAGLHTNVHTTQLDPSSAVQSAVRDPSGIGAADQSHATPGMSKTQASVPKEKEVQNGGLLTSFLGNYGSNSDDDSGSAS